MAVSEVIWRDTYYTSTADTLNYTLSVDNEVIFAGRAYRFPEDDYLKINISKVCQNYLDASLPDGVWASPYSSLTTYYLDKAFRIFELKDENDNTLQTYRFLYGWNYNPSDYRPYASTEMITLSNPVNGHWSGHQWRCNTFYRNLNNSGEVVFQKGVYSSKYPIEVPCGEYALIYCNALGGWDTFLFEGTCSREDKITQYSTNKSFNNQTKEFEKDRYISEIETTYTCNTGWLTDEEAENFSWNLLGTNKAYLHNLVTDEIKPVIIDESTAKYQTYQTNGKKFAQYKIKIKESQQKIRR